ncbi:stage III sporulation protein AF [Salirhabdus salicampi]|uniref:stage III sporulation protein AF n=1 Tax=Salirhabdus salicampi TaxID=476102 RepID=UPI0020C451B4|nr:stage III sporulation protein AF [Salirhabdus salicampi]MCP8616822.1 stage III sporulation protein AF [Salirhabdus salicampi]
MEYIQKWVIQIILFILIAMIIDLLLPQSSMKRYVKFSVGLILMLILLQPLFHLFQTSMSSVMQNKLNIYSQTEQSDMEKTIENQKKEIQASQRAYILNQIAVQLKKQAEEELIRKYEVGIEDIAISFSNEEDLTWEHIDTIEVFLTNNTTKDGTKVEEVVIDTNHEPQEKKPDFAEIKQDLSSFWEVPTENIKITWEGGEDS